MTPTERGTQDDGQKIDFVKLLESAESGDHEAARRLTEVVDQMASEGFGFGDELWNRIVKLRKSKAGKARSTRRRAMADTKNAVDAAKKSRVTINFREGEAVERAKRGDREAARMLLGIGAVFLKQARPTAGLLDAEVGYLIEALEQAYRSPEKIARAFNLQSSRSGRNGFSNESRDARIIRAVEALHSEGFNLTTAPTTSAYAEVAKHWPGLSASAIKVNWDKRARLRPLNPPRSKPDPDLERVRAEGLALARAERKK
ncbi:MAG: hypothetical protein AB7V26_00530 [Lysobacterales bacterium]